MRSHQQARSVVVHQPSNAEANFVFGANSSNTNNIDQSLGKDSLSDFLKSESQRYRMRQQLCGNDSDSCVSSLGCSFAEFEFNKSSNNKSFNNNNNNNNNSSPAVNDYMHQHMLHNSLPQEQPASPSQTPCTTPTLKQGGQLPMETSGNVLSSLVMLDNMEEMLALALDPERNASQDLSKTSSKSSAPKPLLSACAKDVPWRRPSRQKSRDHNDVEAVEAYNHRLLQETSQRSYGKSALNRSRRTESLASQRGKSMNRRGTSTTPRDKARRAERAAARAKSRPRRSTLTGEIGEHVKTQRSKSLHRDRHSSQGKGQESGKRERRQSPTTATSSKKELSEKDRLRSKSRSSKHKDKGKDHRRSKSHFQESTFLEKHKHGPEKTETSPTEISDISDGDNSVVVVEHGYVIPTKQARTNPRGALAKLRMRQSLDDTLHSEHSCSSLKSFMTTQSAHSALTSASCHSTAYTERGNGGLTTKDPLGLGRRSDDKPRAPARQTSSDDVLLGISPTYGSAGSRSKKKISVSTLRRKEELMSPINSSKKKTMVAPDAMLLRTGNASGLCTLDL